MTPEQQSKTMLEIALRLELFVNGKGSVCVKHDVKGELSNDVLISSETFIQWLSRKCWVEFRFRPSRRKISQTIVDLRQMAKLNVKRQQREAEKQRLQREYLQGLQSGQPVEQMKREPEPEREVDVGNFSQEFWIEHFADTQKYDPEWAAEARAYFELFERETGKPINPELREVVTRNSPKEPRV